MKGSITLTDAGALSAVVVVSVTSVEGAVEQGPQQVTTVLAKAPPVVTLSQSATTVSEAGGTDTVTATLSSPSTSDTVVTLTYTEPTSGPAPPPSTLNQLPVNSNVLGVVNGPNGNIWFSAFSNGAGEIGEIDPNTGKVVQTISVQGEPLQMAVGSNDNVWFLDEESGFAQIGEIISPSVVDYFSWPQGFGTAKVNDATSLVPGPDGKLWFGDYGLDAMIGMPMSGTNPTEVAIPIANAMPEGITVANGNLWVVLSNASVIEQFSVTTQAFVPLTLTANSDPQEITSGPNNNLWFTEDGATSQAIGEMTTAGVLVGTFPLANVTFGGETFEPDPTGIVEGPDGNIYFSLSNTSSTNGVLLPPYLGIYKMNANGTASQYYLQSAPTASNAPNMIIGPDNNIWFPIAGQAEVGQIAFASNNNSTPSVPSNIFVSSVTIDIPAGQTSGSVTITGDDAALASNQALVVTMTSVIGAYGEVPQQVTTTLTPAPVTASTAGSIDGTVLANTTSGPGIAGILVYIDLNGNGTFEPVTNGLLQADPFTYTNLAGAYTFSGLAPGSYTVLEVTPPGVTVLSPTSGSINVTVLPGGTATAAPFVDSSNSVSLIATDLSGHPLGSPSFNANGGQIEIEAILPAVATTNVVINLAFSGTAVVGTDYAASGASIFIPAGQSMGEITLTGLPLGVDLSNNLVLTISIASVLNGAPSGASVTATINAQNNVLTGMISGIAYQDNNFNGVKDPGEPLLANAIVFIGPASTNSFGPTLDYFTFTNSAGAFTFDGLTPGTYNVYQEAPANMVETGPLANGTTIRQIPSGAYYYNVSTGTTGLTFGDATLTNPNLSLSLSSPTIASNGGSSTLTVQLSQTTPATVTAVIKVSGLAPYGDYKLVGPGGTIPLSLSNSTFTVTFLEGQTTASYTLTATGDTTNTLESITFDVVSVTNASTNGTAEVEAAITDASGGTTALVVDNPSQISGSVSSGLSFNATPIYDSAGNQPDAITEADLTGNGQLDLIVANGGTSTISVILNPTSSSPTVTNYTVAGTPTGVVSADFNGDGNLDIAVATNNGVTVLLGNGHGGFTVSGTYAAGTGPSAIAAGVFSGNGIMDLAVSNAGSNNISILYGNGNGTFQSAVNIAVGADPVDIKAADLTGNSITDLVVANHGNGANSVSVLINNGSGTLHTDASTRPALDPTRSRSPTSTATAISTSPWQMSASIRASGNINTVSILFGNGNGTFTTGGRADQRPASLPAGTFTPPDRRSGRLPRATSTATVIPTSWSQTTDSRRTK